jgi:hypothetical protein
MGRTIMGINGPFIGKVGPVIGSSWKGIPYIKGPYKRRTRRISKDELASRKRFAMAHFWLQPILDFVREGFKKYSVRTEGFLAAKSSLLRHAFEGSSPDERINPALVKVSCGDLPLPVAGKVSYSPTGYFVFTWDTALTNDTSPDDQVMILAYDTENKDASYKIAGQFRSNGTDSLLVTTWPGRSYHLYIAFVTADRQQRSDSVYLGEWSTG